MIPKKFAYLISLLLCFASGLPFIPMEVCQMEIVSGLRALQKTVLRLCMALKEMCVGAHWV